MTFFLFYERRKGGFQTSFLAEDGNGNYGLGLRPALERLSDAGNCGGFPRFLKYGTWDAAEEALLLQTSYFLGLVPQSAKAFPPRLFFCLARIYACAGFLRQPPKGKKTKRSQAQNVRNVKLDQFSPRPLGRRTGKRPLGQKATLFRLSARFLLGGVGRLPQSI
jgi:hypothetical protein